MSSTGQPSPARQHRDGGGLHAHADDGADGVSGTNACAHSRTDALLPVGRGAGPRGHPPRRCSARGSSNDVVRSLPLPYPYPKCTQSLPSPSSLMIFLLLVIADNQHLLQKGKETLVVLLHHERRARERPLVLGHDRFQGS